MRSKRYVGRVTRLEGCRQLAAEATQAKRLLGLKRSSDERPMSAGAAWVCRASRLRRANVGDLLPQPGRGKIQEAAHFQRQLRPGRVQDVHRKRLLLEAIEDHRQLV